MHHFMKFPAPTHAGRSADNVYMGRGSDRLCTVWVPWSDVPVEHGGLVVLRGSNSLPGFERNPHEHF